MTNYNSPVGDPLPARVGGGAPAFSAVSILAVICAFLALFNVLGSGLGFILAIAAVILGGIGMLAAILPGTRGGIISFIAIGAGLLAVVIALFRLLGHVVSSV
ncbi:MAG: hypothetical protein JWM57_1373 [Phycisphaerales bacterium]|nr:hypothetical protein [Phycisphaerales bacterium]